MTQIYTLCNWNVSDSILRHREEGRIRRLNSDPQSSMLSWEEAGVKPLPASEREGGPVCALAAPRCSFPSFLRGSRA